MTCAVLCSNSIAAQSTLCDWGSKQGVKEHLINTHLLTVTFKVQLKILLSFIIRSALDKHDSRMLLIQPEEDKQSTDFGRMHSSGYVGQ